MSNAARKIELGREEGLSWFEHQLAQGFELSTAVLADRPFDHGFFETFVPAELTAGDVKFPNSPDVPYSDLALAQYLEELARQDARCVVIEDDVQRRTDPKIQEPAAFLGDRVLHWFDLSVESGQEATEAVESGAFGYPLNAFVVTKSAIDLGLVNGGQVPNQLPGQIVRTLLAIVVSAFDATSFATWTTESRRLDQRRA